MGIKGDKEIISGVYTIKNKVNDSIYIGVSVNIYKRWGEHKRLLRKNKHNNTYLQRSWLKYGEANFEFKIIEIVDRGNVFKREVYWVDYFKKSQQNIYNMTDGGEGTTGRVCSYETRRKISESNKGKIPSEENLKILRMVNHTNKKKILQFDLDGNLVREWSCKLEIKKVLNMDTRAIIGCCNKEPRRKTAKGYIWVYKEDYDNNGLNIEYHLKESRNRKAVKVVGTNDIFSSAYELARKSMELYGVEFNNKNISMVCNNKRMTHKGYRFEFVG